MTTFDRRRFLALGSIAIGGVLAGCTKGSKGNSTTTLAGVPGANEFNVALTTNDIVVDTDGRVGFVLRKGTKALEPTDLKVSVGETTDGPFTDVVATTYTDTAGGVPYSVIHHKFTKKGTSIMKIESDQGETTAAVNVVAASAIPTLKPGDKLVPFDSPTFDDHRGVNPICTRKPMCDLHKTTIKQTMAMGRPMAILFATPALCSSATCGPVLDVLLNVAKVNNQARFLHEEIYTDNTGSKQTPTVLAYKLMSEPVLFLAHRNGTIAHRLDGLFGESEVQELLSEL